MLLELINQGQPGKQTSRSFGRYSIGEKSWKMQFQKSKMQMLKSFSAFTSRRHFGIFFFPPRPQIEASTKSVHSTGLEELGVAEATKENNMKSQKTQKETDYTIAAHQRNAGNEKLIKMTTNSRTDIENPKSCDRVSTGYGLAMSVVHHRQRSQGSCHIHQCGPYHKENQ